MNGTTLKIHKLLSKQTKEVIWNYSDAAKLLANSFVSVSQYISVKLMVWFPHFFFALHPECGPQCQRLCLMQHNYYRSLHSSPPLKCDPQLAESAQSWADFMASQVTVQRSNPTNDYAESISWKAWGWKGMDTKLGAIPGAVRSWYSELKRGYDYKTGLCQLQEIKSTSILV